MACPRFDSYGPTHSFVLWWQFFRAEGMLIGAEEDADAEDVLFRACHDAWEAGRPLAWREQGDARVFILGFLDEQRLRAREE